VAGLDTVLGGVRSGLEGEFHTDIFVTGFISNIIIAFFLAYLGDKIGVNLSLAVALVLETGDVEFEADGDAAARFLGAGGGHGQRDRKSRHKKYSRKRVRTDRRYH